MIAVCGTQIYSQSFTTGTTPSSQCTAWTTFQATLTCTAYTLLRLSGSNSVAGINETNPVVVNAIAAALRTSSAYSGTSNGITWMVGACGSGSELSAAGSICSCPTSSLIRPCIGNSNWGGLNSATCGGVSQTITVLFQ